MKKKGLVIALSVMLVLCLAVGGTLAWLVNKTGPVTNTFTVGDINITLDETDYDDSTEGKDRDTANTYKMVPGNTLEKDPLVTVKANSEACWLFVEVVKSDNFDTFMTYGIADEWTPVDGVENVYYMQVAATTADVGFGVLEGDVVTVNNTVTKTMLNGLTEDTYPEITFKAYAVQKEAASTAVGAWTAAQNPDNY